MLEIVNLKAKYKSKKVLEDISIKINDGSVLGILGRNGAGKTTLFNTIYSCHKNDDIVRLNGVKLKKSDIAYVESENYFYPYILGREYMNFFNIDESFSKQINKYFNLPLNEYVHNYSTGMKKKIAILASIATNKKVVILDEPFNGLDFEGVQNLYKIIKWLKTENKIVLMSSHIIETLMNSCDEIYVLNKGRIVKNYPKDSFSVLKKEIDLVI